MAAQLLSAPLASDPAAQQFVYLNLQHEGTGLSPNIAQVLSIDSLAPAVLDEARGQIWYGVPATGTPAQVGLSA